jgi:glycosyltransferase involved in cell wall biosynthesis
MKVLHIGPIGFRPDAGSLPKMGYAHSATGLLPSIRGFASAQVAIGLDVGLMSSTPVPEGKSVEDLPGVCLLKGPNKRHYNPWSISEEWLVRIREEFGTPDVVHFHSTYIPFQIALARRCRQAGWPYIIAAHGGMTHIAQNVKRTKKRIGNFLFFRSYVKQASAIHALSYREAEEIQSLFEVERIITVPNGVEDYLLEASDKLSAADLGDLRSEGDLMLGFVGRIDVYHKGLDLLLEAMAILRSKPDGPRCKLFVIGPFHRKKDERLFYLTVESLGLKDEVTLLGPKYGEEKLRYFLACDVFVHTSRFEGMPMAVLEAMALGRPCLVTPGTNVADIVREGGGWECELDPQSIADTIESICEQKDSLKSMGQQSRSLMRERFTWRKVAQQLAEEYAKIVELSKS